MIIQKLANFESSVITELKEATSHFSFKAYEDSFRKIEDDMETFYKDLSKVREDLDSNVKDTNEWKTKMGSEFITFYQKYDQQITEFLNKNKDESEKLQNKLKEINENMSNSK